MRIAIVGSRNLQCNSFSPAEFYYIHIHAKMSHYVTGTIVSGGAEGIDSIAEGLAKGFGHPTLIFRPEWNKYGKAAAFKRNQKIVDAADKIVAFSINNSPGTEDTIRRAIASGKPTIVYRFTAHPGGNIATEMEEHNV